MLQRGSRLERGYVIERILGMGGMGTVYLARHALLATHAVAIKETMLDVADPREHEEAVRQFRQEAELLSSLEHPGLVGVKDFFEEGGAQYLVMSFVDGRTLSQVVSEEPGFVPLRLVLDWAGQVCEVLAYLHGHEPPVLVRDLKPSNIMLDQQGRIRLIDFGIARPFAPGTETASFLKGAGSVGYAPVEQFSGTTTDARSDIYALGATLYHVLTRQAPPWSMALAAGQASLVLPSQINPDVSPALDAVVCRAMAIRREERYESVAELRVALGVAFSSGSGFPAPSCTAGPSGGSPTVTGTTPSVPHFCMHCGASFAPGARACRACGLPLALPGADAPVGPSPPVAVPFGSAMPPGTPPATGPAVRFFPVPPQEPVPPPSPAGSWRMPVIALAVMVVGVLLWARGLVPLPGPRPAPSPAAVSSPAGSSMPSASAPAASSTPSPSPADPSGALAGCGVHIKSLAAALAMWSTDHEGRYPTSLGAVVPDYLVSLPTCPAAGGDTYTGGYYVSASPPAFTVSCGGANHLAAGAGEDYPLYESSRGLVSVDPDLSLRPSSAEQYTRRGMARLHLHDYEAARDDFTRAIALESSAFRPYMGRGDCSLAQQRLDAAVEDYDRALRLAPRVPYLYAQRGRARLEKKAYDASLDDFGEAIRLLPRYPEAWVYRSLALCGKGQHDNALEALDEAIRLAPRYGFARYRRGNEGYHLARLDAATLDLDQALQLQPRLSVAWEVRAYVHLAAARGRQAAADARQYLAIEGWRESQSRYCVIVATLGYLSDGRPDEARGLLEEAARQCDTSSWPWPVIRFLRGEVSVAGLIEQARGTDELTEAHAYAGCHLALSGKPDDLGQARTHFQWVVANGNKSFFEYPLSVIRAGR